MSYEGLQEKKIERWRNTGVKAKEGDYRRKRFRDWGYRSRS